MRKEKSLVLVAGIFLIMFSAAKLFLVFTFDFLLLTFFSVSSVFSPMESQGLWQISS